MGIYTTNNDTFACSDAECRISCQSPQFGANVCYAMQQNFLDGTPCTGGGKCSNGMCKGGSFGQEVKSWIEKNKILVIALASVLGGIVLLSLTCCVVGKCRRGRQRSKTPTGTNLLPPPPMQIHSQMSNMNASGWQQQMALDSRRSQRGDLAPPVYGEGQRRMRSDRDLGGGQQQMMGQTIGGWRNDGRWDPNMIVDQNGQMGFGHGQGHPQMMQPQPSWQPSVRYA